MGFVGIANQDIPGVAFMPCQEIGWRLDRKYWGKGYATEAARMVLAFERPNIEAVDPTKSHVVNST